uniref:UDENN domain-containing protein n=1 Tax=Ciona savignyi TaxID=51511 RepID=H2ZEE5_CIOSA
RIADYFVVAGHTDSSLPLDEDLAFPNAQHKLSDQRKDPITDICVIDRTLEESCPQGFTCIELTPTGFPADLNYGSLTAHNLLLCYRRGKDKPPLIDLGVFYEGLETVRAGISILETTPAGRSANVNNKSGNHPIYLTFRRAKESAPQNALAVTDICIIFTNKGEKAPYAFCQIEKNLNKGLIGANVYLCYKKSMRQVDSIAFKAGFIGRYPTEDTGSFSLPASVPLFCLPMGATIECWSSKTRHPLPTFSSFVLTTETSDKVFGAVVSFYESYPEEKLTEEQKYKLGILRGDGQRSKSQKTVHTNKAICLLSRWPMFSAFRDFLMYLYRLTVSPQAHSVPVERHIAHFMHNVPFPTAQRPRVQYQMSPMHATILTRPQITPIPLSGASFLALLDDLGPENTLTLLILALTEHKIVIHSLRPAEITCVAEALITLLFPFKWRCTYVPLCPLEMGYVMEAPCPFIVGVDSRYFDIYEPPSDVACVNLDTNSITLMEEKKNISWKMLPKKPAKLLKATLQKYFKEVKDCPREDLNGGSMLSLQDPDLSRTERHRKIDLAIQEAVLKLTASLMKGYRQFLLPITEAPNPGTADPSSLFNIQEFVRSRERSSQRFYQSVVGTQLFSSFIEERCLTSSASLVFFDECIDRLTPDHDHVHLIETDDSQTSDHTVMIMPPDEKGLPPGVGYQYTLFPELQDELFDLGEEDLLINESSTRGRRKSDTFTFGHRTKQELRTMQKLSKFHSGDPQLWARLLISHTYGAWFACLPAFVIECRHKSAALRTAHDALYALKEKNCIPLPDETYYRMLLHLCAVYNKPALAVRVFQFVRKTGIQLSAITYGLYNKAVLEGTWPSSNRDGYMLWQKLRNVFLATKRFQYGLQRRSKFAGSDQHTDPGLRSDETLVNGEVGDPMASLADESKPSDHRPRSVAVSPALHRKPAHGSFKFNHTSSTGSTGGGLASLDVACPDTVATQDGISAFKTPNPTSGDSLTPGISPATPELGNLFGGDAKFLSSLSDSDQLRYQELCSHRNPSAEDSSDVSKSPRYNHSLLSRGRASTSLYPGPMDPLTPNKAEFTPPLLRKMSVPNSTKVARQDISNLEVDPLSPFTKPSTTPEESQPTPAAPGTSDIEVTISSCSKCHKCESLVYDEEIMAGWIADESSLNTHCPFCNSLFVPFLNIEIKPPESLSPVVEGYAGSFVLPLTPDATITSTAMSIGDSQSELNSQIAPQILEPVTIPYLSSLVLRKELESLLENEGTKVLTDPGFVDNHPILYWNLVWYFRRLNLHTNLYKILLRSQLVQQNCKVIPSKKDNVVIHLMWDNLKLHMVGEKPPLYCAWHQIMTQGPSEEFATYSQSFLNDIKDSIMQDDVLGPLVAVLNELNAQRGIRRSAYREILYLIIVALGKSSIDIIAFDREYRRAFDLLSPSERALTRKCDRPPSDHAVDCREIFGELDLY